MLGRAASWDTEHGCSPGGGRTRGLDGWIYPAVRPDGKRIRLLKVLQSSVCENNCAYCAFRRDRDIRRTAFTPDELARLFADLVHRNQAEGLFLSSGICGNAAAATDRMLATADLVRHRYGFKGYLHLKVLPGADRASIEESVRLASRVSTNLEAPNAARLSMLSQDKRFDELLAYLAVADRLRREAPRWVSLTTQYVVGAAGETDAELLHTSARLYRDLGLARAYYSAFQPVSGTPLEGEQATSPAREHRLYQADFLLHEYGFGYDELVFAPDGNLPIHVDPKTRWAQEHPEFFPVELNTADPRTLMRVPGIGKRAAERIITRRRLGRLMDLEHVALRGRLASRVAPYVLLDGRAPAYQPDLWQPALLTPSQTD